MNPGHRSVPADKASARAENNKNSSARRPEVPSRAWRYALLGVCLGLGSPAGLFVLRFMGTFQREFVQWVALELADFKWTYFYLAVGTALAFAIFGYLLGKKSDVLRNQKDLLEQTTRVLRNLSITDGLTHLYVHGYVIKRLEEELARSKRYGYPLACLFIDVDDFKALNDRQGHLFGDEVLSQVAGTLSGELRDSDVLGRYGGDEFLAILPETGADNACKVAERIRISVEKTPVGVSEPPAKVTVSIGVYSSSLLEASSNQILEMADRAMRRAKALGKNRTEVMGIKEKINGILGG